MLTIKIFLILIVIILMINKVLMIFNLKIILINKSQMLKNKQKRKIMKKLDSFMLLTLKRMILMIIINKTYVKFNLITKKYTKEKFTINH